LTAVAGIPFVEPLDGLVYGAVDRLSPLVARVVAENPSKFTYKGTGTYIIGRDEVVVVDPGPNLDSHRGALERALEGRPVRGIVVTHCHSDHVPLSYWLAESTGACTYGFGSHPRPVETDTFDDDDDGDDTARDSGDGEEREHTDFDFTPDVPVRDGETFLTVDGWSLTGIHTPGHTSNHMCVHLDAENALFTGDHIMGWSTTVVSPPDGNMADYMASVRKLMSRSDAILYPTHGNPVKDPAPFLAAISRTSHRPRTPDRRSVATGTIDDSRHGRGSLRRRASRTAQTRATQCVVPSAQVARRWCGDNRQRRAAIDALHLERHQ